LLGEGPGVTLDLQTEALGGFTQTAVGPNASVRYHIDGEIACGGMGAILKGRDLVLNRDVALKVLRDDFRNRAGMMQRFVEEAQIGGQLQHPGVVPIYELGTLDDRRPFFSMKLVKGLTLAALLAGRRSPVDELPRYLGIFEAICQTVAYAHAHDVIHRDLKPSNIMVGDFGEVQVMDWGLAKVLRQDAAEGVPTGRLESELTAITTARGGSADPDRSRPGSVLGTLAYMPPEQARGETDRIDQQADVFALGSMLCEILTCRPAYIGRSLSELHQKAAKGDLDDATSRLKACEADAELIALAIDCMRREPEERPRHAVAVAELMTAYLNGVQERLRAAERDRAVAEATAIEERKRRRLQLGLAVSLLALVLAGGLGANYSLRQRAARLAVLERLVGEAATLRDVAVREPEDVTRWQAALAALRQADAPVRTAGDAGVLRRFVTLRLEVRAGTETARRDRALLDAAADVRTGRQDLGYAGADAAYARAFREAQLDLDRRPPAEIGAELKLRPASVAVAVAAALDDWALVRRFDQPRDARWRRPLEAARAADPDPFRDTVRAAVLNQEDAAREATLRKLAADPKVAELAPASLTLLARTLDDTETAVALLRDAAGRHPDDVWVNTALAVRLGSLKPVPREEQIRHYAMARAARPETAHDLAHLLDDMGRRIEALAVFADLVGRRPENPRHLACYAFSLKARGRREAAATLKRAVTAATAAVQRAPDDPWAHHTLSIALRQQGKPDESITQERTAIRLRPGRVEFHLNLAEALRDQGNLDQAVNEYRTAIQLKPDFAEAHDRLGDARKQQGKLDEAVAETREAIRLAPDHPRFYNSLGVALGDQGKTAEAVAELRAAIRLEPDDAVTHNNLGAALKRQGKLEDAAAELRLASRLDPNLAAPHINLGNVLLDLDRTEEAVAEFHAAIGLEPGSAAVHNNLGLALLRQGKSAEATTEYRTAIQLDPSSSSPHTNLGTLFASQGKLEAAAVEYREAVRLDAGNLEARFNLAGILRAQGRYAESLAAFRDAHERASKRPDWPHPSAQWLREAEQLAAVADRLPLLLRGTDQPRNNAERLAAARMCYETGRHAAATALWTAALAAEPSLADDRQAAHRYSAACAAVLAGVGRSKDDPAPDDTARTRFRGQALEWLEQELAVWSKLVESADPKALATVAATLRHWQSDPDLASLRDATALDRLPETERAQWRAVWDDVGRVLKTCTTAR
jgi:serine/threonine-protein kinase